ncbi:hypothetical protein [Stackebrandtia soli]|uniref:hypothetical protein n=1 Tax=Stackebrandtia soli TaxID=1892856 RepID=UPI0039EB7BA7
MPQYREVLKALVLGDLETANRLSGEVPDSDGAAYHDLVTALFCVMLDHRFGSTADHASILVFVNEMRNDYRHADSAIKPLAIEATIRAFRGEEDLLNEVTPEDTLAARYQVIRKIVLQSEDAQQNIDRYLSEAQDLSKQWSEEA